MNNQRNLHPDFEQRLALYSVALSDLFKALRSYLLEIQPESNELLYHTHALTAVFSLSRKLSDAFCHIPIYTNHLNLGFNKGKLLDDPHQLLQGTGKLIRHIPIKSISDFKNEQVTALIQQAIELAQSDMDKPPKMTGQTISKIKK